MAVSQFRRIIKLERELERENELLNKYVQRLRPGDVNEYIDWTTRLIEYNPPAGLDILYDDTVRATTEQSNDQTESTQAP